VLGTFAMSNPLLHLAKICNQLSLGSLKIGGFMIFAIVFFFSRILLVPWAVLKVAWFRLCSCGWAMHVGASCRRGWAMLKPCLSACSCVSPPPTPFLFLLQA
jgi:hypothetical protein